MNLLIGMVTYGQLKYTKMSVKYLFMNTDAEFDFISVVGKPKDVETKRFFEENNLQYIEHNTNYGFPKSLNDIYEHGFVKNNYDAVVIIGNDVLPYPNAVDYLLEVVDDYDYVSAIEYKHEEFLKRCRECRKFFAYGRRFLKDDFPEFMRVKHGRIRMINNLNKYKIIGDTHNLTLFTRRWFEKVGYVDVNFYPAYFEDNDYGRRGQLAGAVMGQVIDAKYYHFWSRTIKEDEDKRIENDFYFPLNKKFYIEKWGGEPGKEKYTFPFNKRFGVVCGNILPTGLKIEDRAKEEAIIKCWKEKRLV